MKRFFLSLILFSGCFRGYGQNLVINPSLEIITGCPTGGSQLYFANWWESARNSPDYFHTCSASFYATNPVNFQGNQAPADGIAYGGGLMYGGFTPSYSANLREFLFSALSTPLTVGTTYYISFKVSLSDNSEYAVDKIGMQFTTTWNMTFPINNTAHIYNTTVLTDKTNWVTLSGTFVPSVAYGYFMIGNFFNDLNTTVNFVGSTIDIGYCAYYYVDDVYIGTTPLLPVNWTLAEAEAAKGCAKVKWNFDGEGVKNFLVERSAGGKEFAPCGQVNPDASAPYLQFADSAIGYEPLLLYRVRAVMEDGSTHLSQVMEAKFYEAGINSLRVYPSPVKAGEDFGVEFTSGTGESTVLSLVSAEGRLISEFPLEISGPGMYSRNISTLGLAPGMYWIKAGTLSRMVAVD